MSREGERPIWATNANAMLIDEIMHTELAGIDGILSERGRDEDVYDDMKRGAYKLEEVEDALGFTYLIKDNEERDIMEAFDKLYKNGMPLSQIKKSMKDWHTDLYKKDDFTDAVSAYDKFIRILWNKYY